MSEDQEPYLPAMPEPKISFDDERLVGAFIQGATWGRSPFNRLKTHPIEIRWAALVQLFYGRLGRPQKKP